MEGDKGGRGMSLPTFIFFFVASSPPLSSSIQKVETVESDRSRIDDDGAVRIGTLANLSYQALDGMSCRGKYLVALGIRE